MNSQAGNDRKSYLERLIDAPREHVFRAFAEPAQLARWWGPEGFSSSFESFDLRPGGHWRFVMHGPDGTDYPNHNRFTEVEPPAHVVIEHLSEDHHFTLRIDFEAQGECTLVRWRQVFDTVEHYKRIAEFVHKANGQNLDRLTEVVRGMA